MTPEGSSRLLTSVGTTNFTQRFSIKYDEWVKKYLRDDDTKEEKDRVETDSTLPDHKIHGSQNEIKSLHNFLLDQKVDKDFKSLVIVGEYGVGKTALCKMIFNDEDVKSVYAPRIWVSMHTNETNQAEDNKISVLTKILKDLGVEDSMLESIHEEVVEEAAKNLEAGKIDAETAKERELSALLYALHLNLRWKKYLIVFDDVREEDNWNEMRQGDEEKQWGKYLSDGFSKGSGGRVIYTTRDENLAKKLVAEEHEIHRLWPLTDTGSVWKIYEAVIDKKGKKPPMIDKKCMDELMNKSRGLPLAARLLAELDPVLLDDESAAPDGSNHGPADSGHAANNPTSEENKIPPPQQT